MIESREQLEAKILRVTLLSASILATLGFAAMFAERELFRDPEPYTRFTEGMLLAGILLNLGSALAVGTRDRRSDTIRRWGFALLYLDFAIVAADALFFSRSLLGVTFGFLSMTVFVILGGILSQRLLPQAVLASLIAAGYAVAVFADPAGHIERVLPEGDSATRVASWGILCIAAILASALAYNAKEGILVSYFRKLSYYDHDTGLPNGKLLEEDLRERAGSLRKGQRITLFALRLVGFGDLSGLVGHEEASRWLRHMLDSFSASLENWRVGCHSLAFFSGRKMYRSETDVFYVPVLMGEASLDPLACARNLQTRLKGDFLRNESESGSGFFGAFASYPDDADSAAGLRGNVSRMLSRTTPPERNTFIPFNEALHSRYLREVEIRGALLKPDFAVHLTAAFQPKIEVATGRCVGFETLARWNPPGLGPVPPDEFIPIAEESQAIETITGFVIKETVNFIRLLNRSRESNGTKVSFNLSPRLVTLRFLSGLAERLSKMDEVGQLEIEITEGVLVSETEEVREQFRRLRDLGVHFSIDDFGSGYSNISYLQGFRADTLKIDRRFVGGLPSNSDDANLVRAMLAMARLFSMRAVVEGVETEAQADFLAEIGCDHIQGYLYSRPVPAEDAIDFFLSRSLNASPSLEDPQV